MKLSAIKLSLFLTLLVFLTSCEKENDVVLNVVPTADAGTPKAITLPTNSVTLTGTGTDADGTIVAYLWSQKSGPAATVIVNPGSPSTVVNGLTQGNYIFQLMVTDDDGATGVDTVSVTVAPAPEQTLTFQPTNNPTDIQVAIIGTSGSGGPTPDIPLAAWTNGGTPLYLRHLLKFDWGTIPQNSTIVSATLYLYSHPVPTLNGNFQDANWGSNNAFTIQRISNDWSPATTTWANQPTGAATNQITVPHTPLSSLDLTIDVTALVSTMVSTNANYGFLMKLQSETIYTIRQFVSSWTTLHPTKRPKLVIVYR